MKRAVCLLTVLGILCVAASQAQAHDYYHHGGRYHHSYFGVVVPAPPVVVSPRVYYPVAPAPVVYPRAVYYPTYRYRYCQPVPRGGFYYQGRGLSLGVGW